MMNNIKTIILSEYDVFIFRWNAFLNSQQHQIVALIVCLSIVESLQNDCIFLFCFLQTNINIAG